MCLRAEWALQKILEIERILSSIRKFMISHHQPWSTAITRSRVRRNDACLAEKPKTGMINKVLSLSRPQSVTSATGLETFRQY